MAKKKTISAKAVVLTTGGFGANMEMVTEYNPALNGFVTTKPKKVQLVTVFN